MDNRSRGGQGTFFIGILLFGAILIYLGFITWQYFHTTQIAGYQVREGSLSTNNIFTAIALREEKVFYSSLSGYLNYYAREGEKVATGNLVYAVDESGRLQDYVAQGDYGENKLKNEDLSAIREDIMNFASAFSPAVFDPVYDFKADMESDVQKLSNASLMEGIGSLNSTGAGLVGFCYASEPGIVVYSTDGYEELMPAQVTAENFDRESYERHQFFNGDMISNGDAIYKECVSEDWSVVIQVDEEKAAQLEEAGYVRVRFLKNQDEIVGKVSVFRQDMEHIFAQVSFTNSMIIFCRDRFLDVELILDETMGLKVPKSSIVEKEFYLIPEEYVFDDFAEGSQVLRRTYMEDGTLSQESVHVTIHQYDEENKEYYIDDTQLNLGDMLLKLDSPDLYTVSKRGSLTGVYNINKGYADFKRVEVLSENEEYAIVKPNSAYGLNEYDFIVLEADKVQEDDFIYE